MFSFPPVIGEIEQNKQMFRIMCIFKILVFLLITAPYALESATDCSKLRVGQKICPDPDRSYKYIDEETQSIFGCTREGTAKGDDS